MGAGVQNFPDTTQMLGGSQPHAVPAPEKSNISGLPRDQHAWAHTHKHTYIHK